MVLPEVSDAILHNSYVGISIQYTFQAKIRVAYLYLWGVHSEQTGKQEENRKTRFFGLGVTVTTRVRVTLSVTRADRSPWGNRPAAFIAGSLLCL